MVNLNSIFKKVSQREFRKIYAIQEKLEQEEKSKKKNKQLSSRGIK